MGARSNDELRALIYANVAVENDDSEMLVAELGTGLTDAEMLFQKALPDGGATDTLTLVCMYSVQVERIVRIVYAPIASLTANDSNYALFTFASVDQDGTATTIASANTKTVAGGGTGNWTAYSPVDIPLVSPPVELQGEYDSTTARWLRLAITKPGNGVVVPAGSFFALVRKAGSTPVSGSL